MFFFSEIVSNNSLIMLYEARMYLISSTLSSPFFYIFFSNIVVLQYFTFLFPVNTSYHITNPMLFQSLYSTFVMLLNIYLIFFRKCTRWHFNKNIKFNAVISSNSLPVSFSKSLSHDDREKPSSHFSWPFSLMFQTIQNHPIEFISHL